MSIGQNHPLAGRRVAKMNGAGNEIVVLDLRGSDARVTGADARAIGAAPGLHYDQLMVLHDAAAADAAASMKIFNIDGSLSGACGNGTRCVAWELLRDSAERRIKLESDGGLLHVTRDNEWSFTVDMGPPKLDWRDIPLAGDGGDTKRVALAPAVAGAPKEFSGVSMGNPHAVFFVADAMAIDLAIVGAQIETHPLFPERVNVSFAEVRARDSILLRVWERGAGATRACGTAACATAVASARLGLTDRAATVSLPGGDLRIHWRESDDHVLMSGPVELEFETNLDASVFAREKA
jgi:diaminopimelate epimerase